jgi:hypothetical protein
MTRAALARTAGAVIPLYRTIGVVSFLLYENSLGGRSADIIAAVQSHTSDLRIACIMTLVYCLLALVIGVSLYFYTRNSGVELATFGLVGRTAEAALYGVFALSLIALVSIATSSTGASRDIDVRLLVEIGRSAHRVTMTACVFFAAGNAAFAWLLVRARLAPRFIAVIGLFGALIPLAGMPMQMIGALRGFPTPTLWIATFLFELMFSVWLLVTGGRDRA